MKSNTLFIMTAETGAVIHNRLPLVQGETYEMNEADGQRLVERGLMIPAKSAKKTKQTAESSEPQAPEVEAPVVVPETDELNPATAESSESW